jgi:hypothetical protein
MSHRVRGAWTVIWLVLAAVGVMILQPVPLSIEERTRCTTLVLTSNIDEGDDPPVVIVTASGCVDIGGRSASEVAPAPRILAAAWEHLDRPAAQLRLLHLGVNEPFDLTMTAEQLAEESASHGASPSTRPFDLKRDGLWRVLPVLLILVVVGLVRTVRCLRSAGTVILVARF